MGRVVVPKEIRRTLRIREGDPLEIYTAGDGSVVLRKFSPVGELSEFAKDFSGAIENALSHTVLICDKDTVISANGEYRKEYAARPVSKQLEAVIESRTPFMCNSAQEGTCIPVYEGEDLSSLCAQIIRPIISESHKIVEVMVIRKSRQDQFGETEMKSAQVAAEVIGAQLSQ